MKNIIERSKTRLHRKYKGFITSRRIVRMIMLSKRLVLPGFEGLPIYDVGFFFYNGLKKGDISNRAAALSFNSFLAIFPAIIFFFTLIPYVPITDFQDSLIDLLKEFIPNQTYQAVEGTLFDIIKRPRGGLLSLGFFLAMFFATNAVNNLIEAFNKTYYSVASRTPIKQRLVSILLVFILSVLVIMAIVLITVGPVAIRWVEKIGLLTDWLTLNLISAGKWVIIFALLFFAFSFLYYFAPTVKHRFKFITAGSTLATILFILTSVGFNFYVNNFAAYNTLYGSIGTLIVFMLWLYFNSIIILLGWELNSSISVAKRNILSH